MCEYDDSDAFEIWAQSLIATEDFELALGKIKLAIENCQVNLILFIILFYLIRYEQAIRKKWLSILKEYLQCNCFSNAAEIFLSQNPQCYCLYNIDLIMILYRHNIVSVFVTEVYILISVS